ncbi:MAG: hypothetical protein HUU55_20590 [Myxococcales bacterium]|nr:hypothetical protein [Myxococcales bacterium]
MKKLLLPVVIFMVFVFGSAGLRAQTTVFGPEQDCVNALTICQPLIKQPYSYKGDGYRILELLNSPACLPSPGEKNGVWYRLKAGASGKLGFTITALDASDNYDWAVFRAPLVSDAIDNACIRIKSDATLLIGCNASNLPLPTGPNDGVGEQNSAKIDVNAGETILIYISNFSGKSGFVLDLSSSSAGVVPTAPATTKAVGPVWNGCENKPGGRPGLLLPYPPTAK